MNLCCGPKRTARSSRSSPSRRPRPSAKAIEALTGLETQVKWVNDVLVGGRKVCGILTEAVSDFESGRTESVIVGIGVNVKTPPALFPAELRESRARCCPRASHATGWPPRSPTGCSTTSPTCRDGPISSPTGGV
ncbi:MAG: biotin--[acetyl-CoA-carboxylase] ligase [Anaerotruncus massiliensis (ex Togo et al. 2019)]